MEIALKYFKNSKGLLGWLSIEGLINYCFKIDLTNLIRLNLAILPSAAKFCRDAHGGRLADDGDRRGDTERREDDCHTPRAFWHCTTRQYATI